MQFIRVNISFTTPIFGLLHGSMYVQWKGEKFSSMEVLTKVGFSCL